MMNESPFERQTENVQSEESQRQTKLLTKLSLSCEQRNIQSVSNVLSQLGQTIYDKERQYINEEIMIMSAIFTFLKGTGNQEKLQSIKRENLNTYYQIRILTLILCIKLNKGKTMESSEIINLCSLLRDQKEMKSQVVLKLTGAKSIETMKDITSEDIEQFEKSQVKKAIKYQIVADWKYINNQDKLSIKFKNKSLQFWKNNDKLKNYNLCLSELQDIKKLYQGNKTTSIYAHKLINLKNILIEIQKVGDVSTSQQQEKDKNTIATKSIMQSILKDFNNEQNKLKQSKMSSSKVKKSETIYEERKSLGQSFHYQALKNNYKYNQFLPKNRFTMLNLNEFIKKMGIFNKLVRRRDRFSYDKIIEWLKSFPQY